jgi:hypothetical protein
VRGWGCDQTTGGRSRVYRSYIDSSTVRPSFNHYHQHNQDQKQINVSQNLLITIESSSNNILKWLVPLLLTIPSLIVRASADQIKDTTITATATTTDTPARWVVEVYLEEAEEVCSEGEEWVWAEEDR